MKHYMDLFERDANLVKVVATAAGISDEEAAEQIADLNINDVLTLVDAASHNNSDEVVKLLKNPTAPTRNYAIGDEVEVEVKGKDGKSEKVEGVVKVPDGPSNTVGVLINGEMKMIKKRDINLAEGVLGMTGMPGLSRMKELAGMVASGAADPDAASAQIAVEPETVVVDAVPVPSATTEGDCCPVTAIMDAISVIEANMPDIKVSEYKQIADRLNALQNRIFQESVNGRQKKPV